VPTSDVSRSRFSPTKKLWMFVQPLCRYMATYHGATIVVTITAPAGSIIVVIRRSSRCTVR
jgi:hypothetical protein